MKFFFKICLLFSSLFAGKLTYDLNMSPYAGANDLLFATDVVERFQPFKGESWKMRAARACEMAFFYLPLNYFTSVVQHEVFGHGYRIRDINHGRVWGASYEFTLPPPYGPGNGSTNFYIDSDQITTTDLSLISIAGFEAQSILAFQTKYNWLQANKIDGRETILYLVSQLGINLYATGDGEELGHDINGYLFALHLTYPDAVLAESRIRALSWINLADPFLYYSAFAWFQYIAKGKPFCIPMIPIRDWGYLFGARLGLTPFGPEYYLDNFLLKESRPIYFYIRAGAHAKNRYYGAGFYSPQWITRESWALGMRFDAWSQQQWGLSSSFIASYQKNFGIEAEIGYKTEGYLPGYSIYAKPTIRISFLSSF
jgi:hypothetical protein